MGKITNLSDYVRDKEERRLSEEHESLIDLIKFFVDFTQVKNKISTIEFTETNKYIIYNEDGSIFEYTGLKIIGLNDENMPTKDKLVSSLISLSPETIVIKGSKFMDDETKEYLNSLFEKKIKFC